MTKDDVHKLLPRTFSMVVLDPTRVSVVLTPRAYGAWNSSRVFRSTLASTLQAKFLRVTVIAPLGSRPFPRSRDRVLADWEQPTASMY